jgi:hypothetical protein
MFMANMYVERSKAKYGLLDDRTRYAQEVYIPIISLFALLGVTAWIISDAVAMIQSGGDGDDVNFPIGFHSWQLHHLFRSIIHKRGNKLVGDHLHNFSLDRRRVDWQNRPTHSQVENDFSA